MVMAFALAALTWSGIVQVWHVLAISLVLGGAFAFDAPARQAFTVDMVGKRDLMNAVALNSAIFNGARVLGPAIGAIALAWQGPALAFFLNGLSYLAVLAGLAKMEVSPDLARTGSNEKRVVREGLAYVLRNDSIRTLLLLVATVSVFAFPYAVLMPVFADTILRVGKEGYGLLMTVSGIGSLAGALGLTLQSGRSTTRRGRIILAGAIGLPVFLAAFALSTDYLLSLIMLIGVGWTMISINATINTVVQTSVPDELRGRVNGVFAFLFVGMAPIGNLQAGLVADRFGAPTAVFAGALVCGIAALYIVVRKRHIVELS
jgi:MFS family permease